MLFNSYHLNTSERFWQAPEKFNPSRFVSYANGYGHIIKPDNFFPFSSGRRACLGYKMVQTISFCVAANLILKYEVVPLNALHIEEQLISKGCLALLPDDCFKVALRPRPETAVN